MKKNLLVFLTTVIAPFFPNAQENNTEESKTPKKPDLVLVFTKTEGYRHKSIEKGVATLRELGRENNFIALQSESGEDFNAENLSNYQLVVFLNTTENVLNESQQDAFESYIKNGGSFFGIHAAADTEYDWPWYGQLVGGYFAGHPKGTPKATIQVLDQSHPSTSHLPNSWIRVDEWYNYKNLSENISVLMNLDESTYEGGTNGENHPIAWYHEFDGGRAYYTGGGHTDMAFEEPNFKKHIIGAIEWCLSRTD